MNLIEPLSQQVIENDIPPSVAVSLTIFLGAVLGGYYFIDLVQRWKTVETRIDELETIVHETDTMLVAQADTIHEHDLRIREKQDFDETDELEEGKYQAWKGFYHGNFQKCEIRICREKISTFKKNQEWTAWSNGKDSSTTVRDFYMGNLHPDFHWTYEDTETYFTAKVSDTFINGWDSVIRIDITFTFPSKQELLQFIEQEHFNGNPTINAAFQKYLEKEYIIWSRILIDACL